MTSLTAETSRNQIRDAAVQLLNRSGVGAVTVASLCAEAHITESAFATEFGSVDAVFGAIVRDLIEAHSTQIAATVSRRRSLTETIQLAMVASFAVVESRIDEHRAGLMITVSHLVDSGHGPSGSSVYEAYVRAAEAYLLEIQRIHSITWELSTRLLAKLFVATLIGLTVDYLFTRDAAGSRHMLDVSAYQLAQHGRRTSKNQAY
jgi:AcrR family transcriptional regulator